MTTGIRALDEVDLETLDQGGRPPKPSRLSSAGTIRDLYQQLIKDDENSARARAQVQAMKDGEPPFNQAKLNASGQGSRANAEFLMGLTHIAKVCNGFNDIITSTKTLMTVEVDYGQPSERIGFSRKIATELTRTIRKWPSFFPNFLRLADLFVTHGVGIAYFQDTQDFRFDVCGFGDFLIPRGTKASEERIIYAVARKDMTVTDLFQFVEDPEKATKLGWNVDAVKAAILRATTASSTGQIGELEEFQQQIKNNDLFAHRKFVHVPILCCWVKEFDGTYSFFLTEKDHPSGDFLFKEYSRYESSDQAFIFFCYGIGNGTFHSIRGLGNQIFALVKLHSRIMCQKADAAMLADAILVQADSGTALQNATLNYLGPMAMLSPGFEIMDRKFSSGGDQSLNFLGEVKGLMAQNSSQFTSSTEGVKGEAYQNNQAVLSKLEATGQGDSGSVDLFYASLDRAIREMCRRIIQGPKSDKLVAEFHERCLKAGITKEILDAVDHDSTYARRALGAGNPAARSASYTRLMQWYAQLDEIGRKNLMYELVSNEVGYTNADEFASMAEEPRLNAEASLANLENILLMQGSEIPVLSYQMHATHVQIHAPHLIRVLDGVDTGEIDPMEVLGGLQASLNHLAGHAEALAQDPTQAEIYGQVKEVVNNLQMVVTNMGRKIKAEQRQGGGEPQPGQPDTAAALEQTKLDLAQFKLDLARRKGELELAMIQSKGAQAMALADAKMAMSIK